MKTYTKNVEIEVFVDFGSGFPEPAGYKTEERTYTKISELKKAKPVIHTKAVDYCHPNYYLLDGYIWCEDTRWENTRLVGCGEAYKMCQEKEFNWKNYFLGK